jgi:O-antigen biosynthesis protein
MMFQITLIFKRAARAWGLLKTSGTKGLVHRLRFGKKTSLSGKYFYMIGSEVQYQGSEFVDQAPRNTINWFFDSFLGSSGGHINAFRFLKFLEASGYECRVVFTNGKWMGSSAQVLSELRKAFGPLKAEVFLDANDAPPSFASVATGFCTSFVVANFSKSQLKFYFVQDYEPWFCPAGSEAIFAEQSYRLGLIGLTAGDWLAKKLTSEFRMETHPFGFSFDRTNYHSLDRVPNRTKRVLFYARPETARRGFELGILALSRLHKIRPDVEIVLAGSELAQYDLGFPCVNCGVVAVSNLGKLYRSCDVALVLSFTNASLLPLELMACGTAVVSNRGDHVEWLINSSVSKLVDPTIEGISTGIVSLIDNPIELEKLQLNGIAFSNGTNWTSEGNKVVAALQKHGCIAEI